MTFPSQLWAMTPMSMGYINKVLKPNSSIGYDPSSLIGFWPQNEKSGLVSIDHSGLGRHGAYQGVDLGQAGVPGMGLTSPFYDGVNDFNNIYSPDLANDSLLLNGGFETPGGGGADIWANWTESVGDGAFTNEVVIVHEGADAAKITTGPTANTWLNQTFAVIPGERYRFRFWTRGDGANQGRYELYDVTNSAYIDGTRIPTGVPGVAYTMVTKLFTAPPGCVSIFARFWCSTVNTGVCYFDACEIRRTNGFLGDRGSIILPAQVANAGVWTDATARFAIQVGDGNLNRVFMYRTGVNNQFSINYRAGGVTQTVNILAAPLGFAYYGITWDITAGATGEMLAFSNGIQTGVTQVGLGTWELDMVLVGASIGGIVTGPANVWYGNIGPALLYNEAKTPAEMLYLSTP